MIGAVNEIDANLSHHNVPIYTDANCYLLGIIPTTTFSELIEGNLIPKNTIVKLWINDSTTYGIEMREEITSKFKQDVYGYCTIDCIGDEKRISLKAYDNHECFTKLYTDINNIGWASEWNKTSGTLPKHKSLGNGKANAVIALDSTWENYTIYLVSVAGTGGCPWSYAIFTRGGKCAVSQFYSDQYNFCLSGVIADGVFTPDSNWSKYILAGSEMELSNLRVYVHGLA